MRPILCHRTWLGGTLTNFATIKKSIGRFEADREEWKPMALSISM